MELWDHDSEAEGIVLGWDGVGCWRRIINDVPRWDSWSMTMDVVDIDVKVR